VFSPRGVRAHRRERDNCGALSSVAIRGEFVASVMEIALADDVVAVEYPPRSMAGEGHRHLVRYPRPHEVPHSRPAAVVKHEGLVPFSPSFRPP
jgi:hypothetical protein